MQGKFTFVKINEKNMFFVEKDIPIWWSFIFAEGPFYGKIRPCFHHLFQYHGTNQLQNFDTKIPVFRANLSCMVEVKKNLLTVAGCHP